MHPNDNSAGMFGGVHINTTRAVSFFSSSSKKLPSVDAPVSEPIATTIASTLVAPSKPDPEPEPEPDQAKDAAPTSDAVKAPPATLRKAVSFSPPLQKETPTLQRPGGSTRPPKQELSADTVELTRAQMASLLDHAGMLQTELDRAKHQNEILARQLKDVHRSEQRHDLDQDHGRGRGREREGEGGGGGGGGSGIRRGGPRDQGRVQVVLEGGEEEEEIEIEIEIENEGEREPKRRVQREDPFPSRSPGRHTNKKNNKNNSSSSSYMAEAEAEAEAEADLVLQIAHRVLQRGRGLLYGQVEDQDQDQDQDLYPMGRGDKGGTEDGGRASPSPSRSRSKSHSQSRSKSHSQSRSRSPSASRARKYRLQRRQRQRESEWQQQEAGWNQEFNRSQVDPASDPRYGRNGTKTEGNYSRSHSRSLSSV